MFGELFKFNSVVGGVHLKSYHKDRSAALTIAKAELPKQIILPLRQHAGADAVPVVKVGDYVFKGQLIAEAGSEISAPVHASSSGVVKSIGPVVAPHPSGLEANAIIIDCDGKDQWEKEPSDLNPFEEDRMILANKVAEAGVVGLGGAIFPAAVKLKQGARHEIKTVIINGSECEPYLTCDDRLMRERMEDIVDGARLIQYILRAWRVVIAIEDNKKEAIAAAKAAVEPYGALEVKVVPTQYPMGSAKQLIHAVIGREVPAGARSTSVGTLVHNVGTVYAIQQALRYGRPLISRVVTIAGDCVESPRNIEALIGTPIEEILNQCGGLKTEPSRLVMGGPMMGVNISNLRAPLIKGATGILALGKKELPKEEQSPCVRCARCVEACPMGLLPLEMASMSKVDNFDGANEYGLNDCILCGSCSYVCPSHIPLVQYFQYAKGEQDARKKAAKKTEYTKLLAEARSQRIETEKAAKAAAKAKKKKRATTQSKAPEAEAQKETS